MSWLDKLFGKEEIPTAEQPVPESVNNPLSGIEGIRFGRYSDNNKSYARTKSWYLADDHFKAKEYPAAFAAFFDYIRDDEEQNVQFTADGDKFSFELIQGSKKLYGSCDGKNIEARISIAKMVQPSNAVMRRLLEMNYSLYYSHCALDADNILCMIFSSPVEMAAPAKLYYALREMSIFADRQDDLLVIDFNSLEPIDTGHVSPIPEAEAATKFRFFGKWIEEAQRLVKDLNADSFSGAISYIYLTLLFRIDFLIVPEAKLMADLEDINRMYWNRKDEIPIVDRNAMMKEGINKLPSITQAAFKDGLYRTKGTFAVAQVPHPDKLRENVYGANKDAIWYIENKYPEIALIINEYGMMYNQFAYSLPKVISDLNIIYMAVIHADYFEALGLKEHFVNPENGQLDKELITRAITDAISKWNDKYESISWNNDQVNYSSVWEFAKSFSEQVVNMNLEVKR